MEQLLPLPPEEISKRFDALEENPNPTEFIALADNFEYALREDAVVKLLYANLFKWRAELQQEILQGQYDEWGRDATPNLRSGLAMIEKIIALPATLKFRKEEIQTMHLGVNLEEHRE